MGYAGLVDMDVQYGSPRNILHIALSLARTDGSDYVGLEHLHEAIDKYKEALVSTFNVWDDRDIVFAHHGLGAAAVGNRVYIIGGGEAQHLFTLITNSRANEILTIREEN